MTISVKELMGGKAVRGLGNPLSGMQPPEPPNFTKAHLAQFERDGWLRKTFFYRHDCMMNLAAVTEQLTDGKMLVNKELLEARKQYLLDEINVCHRMLTLFSKELN